MIEDQRGHQKYQISILTTREKKRIFQCPENTVPGPKTIQHLSPTRQISAYLVYVDKRTQVELLLLEQVK